MPISLAELLHLLDERYTEADKALISHAYTYAREAHEGQSRHTGEPYFSHCTAVAKKLIKLKLPAEVIAAGILHDVPEDTRKTLEDIRNDFGEDIEHMVAPITKIGKIKYRGQERYAENLRKMFVAMAQDIRVIFIKFADRLHNLETLYALPEAKRQRIATEVMEIYAPIANRLGMGEYRGQFEDYAFKYLDPKNYSWTNHLLEERVKKFGPSLERALKEVRVEMERFNVQVLDLHGRVKHCHSLWRKLQKYKGEMDNVYDIVALRIIVPDIAACYAAFGVIHGLYTPLPGRIKDYIAQPKPNGYQSLHTTVFDNEGAILEFQIRTKQMHEENEYGVAAHWRYKERTPDTTHHVEWMEELAVIQKELSTSDFLQELGNLKLDMFRDRIFVFTPHGDVIDLPEESTPIDMAYAIHSDIGNKAIQARVNGEARGLDTTLRSGDVCEIVIDKNRKAPSEEWIKFVKTRHARQKIKDALRGTKKSLWASFIKRG